MSEPTLLTKGYIKDKPDVVPINYIINQLNAMKQKSENILILKSTTGSGKSTVLPIYLLNRDLSKKVIMIEPRIFTVLSLTKRLISQKPLIENMPPLKLGKNIGYHTGHYFRLPPEGGIVFITFGSFIRFFENESDEDICKAFSAIVVDEAHEMELFSSNVYKRLREFAKRNKGKNECPSIIFTSATLDEHHFSKYFNNAPIISVRGHNYTITDHYLEYDTTNYLETVAETILKICEHKDEPESKDILVFFPGVTEIENFIKFFRKFNEDSRISKKIMLVPVYRKIVNNGGDRFDAVTKSAAELGVDRKAILATNIGETGITYKNLKYVIDIGQFKSIEYIYDFNAQIIYNKMINRLSQEQRRGRVGRQSDGEYYAMFSKETAEKISGTISNQMYKDDITMSILYLLADNPSIDLLNLDLIYNPAPIAVWRATEKLFILGLINSNFALTPMGLVAAKLKGISIEQTAALLAGFTWKAPMLDLITIIATLNFRLEYKKRTIFADECECDIIPAIELLHTGELVTLLGADYENFTELRDNLIDTLAVCGLDPFAEHEHCYPNTKPDYIKTLKQCLFEGYKLNSAYWDGTKHITQAGNELFTNFYCHINNFIYTDLIIKKENDSIIKTPQRISVLDNYINYTPDFF